VTKTNPAWCHTSKKGDKKHSCGHFCPFCACPTCQRSKIFTVLRIDQIRARIGITAAETLTLPAIAEFFHIPARNLAIANLPCAVKAATGETCDCAKIHEELEKRRNLDKKPRDKRWEDEAVQLVEDRYVEDVAPTDKEEDGDVPTDKEEDPVVVDDPHDARTTEEPPPDNSDRKFHGRCTNKHHMWENQTLKSLTHARTDYMTPNLYTLVPTLASSDELAKAVNIPDKVDGADVTIRVRNLPPVRSYFLDCCYGTHYKATKYFIPCILHGMMGMCRGALVYTDVKIRNEHEKVEIFNQRFKKFGVTMSVEGKDATPMACKGGPAWGMIQALGGNVTCTQEEGGHGWKYTANEGHLLSGLDDDRNTMGLWYWMYRVFKIGRGTLWVSTEQKAEFKEACFHLKVAFAMKGSSEKSMPFYVHIVCDHGYLFLNRWHSLWAFSNNIAESYNKALNIAQNHTTRGGANGRTNREAQGPERRAEVSPSMMAHGLVQVAKQFQLSKYFSFKDIIDSDAMRIAARRIWRFFRASLWGKKVMESRAMRIAASEADAKCIAAGRIWRFFRASPVWKKVMESRLRASQLRESTGTLDEGADRGIPRRRLVDKTSEHVVGDGGEHHEDHMDMS
jgi:hypothetical protein